MQFRVGSISPPVPLVPGSAAAVRLHSRLSLATHGAALLDAGEPFPSPAAHQAKQAAYSARRSAWLAQIGWTGGEE